MGTEKFCLKWNDFESNISLAFREIRDEKDFFDVTLACDDDQLQAHKVILSACSPFFRNILKRNPHQHPLLYLKGVKYSDLQSVLNFMYHGEVNVAQDELNSFLAVAEELRVKGLTQNNGSQSAKGREPVSKSPPPIKSNARPSERDSGPPPKRPRPTPPTQITPPDDDDIQEVVPVKSEPRDSSAVISTPGDMYQPSSNQQSLALTEEDDYGQDESYDDYGQYGDGSYDGQMMDPSMAGGADGNKGTISNPKDLLQFVHPLTNGDPGFVCGGFVCGLCFKFKHVWRTNVRNHIESIHYKGHFVYNCDICGQVKNSKQDVYSCKSEHRRKSKLP
ncbi:protein tramtrack, beta isoform isoform X10 [Eurytemora carolleeae]|uniref:protein tramtrack, beta isoform isoform X10 n=1 Tax=Eurytemora carolleeae TaxID=1294199 RepID=UPI000C7659B6|nr:protein tramtrack, beta isoform isoform X10 [Eurytemora carolleeae]|eukprot:XP_023339231.1 protein tramtrack, beta isoform-like isoform X10 [Eurytemora affinis]